MGGRDHSTVLHAIRKVSETPDLLDRAVMWRREVLKLERQLYDGTTN
jgi:chromosomal replication initiation ATPase DnaA